MRTGLVGGGIEDELEAFGRFDDHLYSFGLDGHLGARGRPHRHLVPD